MSLMWIRNNEYSVWWNGELRKLLIMVQQHEFKLIVNIPKFIMQLTWIEQGLFMWREIDDEKMEQNEKRCENELVSKKRIVATAIRQ